MPRPPSASWHKASNCWSSAVGDLGASGRRKSIYFRNIPYGPKGSANHRKAQDALRSYLDAREARTRRGSDHTVGDLSRLYLLWLKDRVASGRNKPATFDSALKALKKLRGRELGPNRLVRDRPARDLTATDLARVVEGLRDEGRKPNYIARIVAVLQGVLNWAARPISGREPERLIPANPVARFSHEATRAPQSADRYAADAEVEEFLRWGYERADGMGGLVGRFERSTVHLIEVASLTGARPGELRVAEWGDFDPRATFVAELGEWWGRIRLDPSRWKSGGKTGKPRDVYLPPRAVEIVESLQAVPMRHPRYIFTHRRRNVTEESRASVREHGEVWSMGALSAKIRHLRRLAILGGVSVLDEGDNRFVMYRLRHTAAAKLLMAGVDIGTVATLLGTSTAMIQTTYGSYTSGHLAKAAARGFAPAKPAGPPPTAGPGEVA